VIGNVDALLIDFRWFLDRTGTSWTVSTLIQYNQLCFKIETIPGATWLRRRLQSSVAHTEDPQPRKSAGKKIVANDEKYSLAA